MSSKVKCFYHDDMDGICSAQIVKMRHKDAECFEVDYEGGFPWDKIEDVPLVYMVDYGLQPFEGMIELNSKCHLIWIDHHKTAIDAQIASGVEIAGLRRTDKAGCELTWEVLFPGQPVPEYVKLLADFDMWRRDNISLWDDVIEPFEIAMIGLPNEQTKPGGTIWKDLAGEGSWSGMETIEKLVQNGNIINSYLRKQNEDACKKYSFEVEIGGKKFIALNTPHRSSSQLESVYDVKKHDGSCIYRWTGKEYTFSLYSTKEGINCGAIAKMYNGGGHFGAAGGKWTKEEFVKIFEK